MPLTSNFSPLLSLMWLWGGRWLYRHRRGATDDVARRIQDDISGLSPVPIITIDELVNHMVIVSQPGLLIEPPLRSVLVSGFEQEFIVRAIDESGTKAACLIDVVFYFA